MKRAARSASPATRKGKESLKPVKPSAPGSSRKTPRKSRHSTPKKSASSPRTTKKKDIQYDDYLAKTLMSGSLGQGEREIHYKIVDQGAEGNVVLYIHVVRTEQKWSLHIPHEATENIMRIWRMCPRMSDWSSFCRYILTCATIEFTDGVILSANFDSNKFRVAVKDILANVTHISCERIQLAWLSYKARRHAALLQLEKNRRQAQVRRHLNRPASEGSIHDSFDDKNDRCDERNEEKYDDFFRNDDENTVNTELSTTSVYSCNASKPIPFIHDSAQQPIPLQHSYPPWEQVSTVRQAFPGSDLEKDPSANELHEIKSQLDAVLMHLQKPSENLSKSNSLFGPGISVKSVVSEEVAEDIQNLRRSVSQHDEMYKDLTAQLRELKTISERMPEHNTTEIEEKAKELEKELKMLRDEHAKFEKRNETAFASVVAAMEKTAALAEELKNGKSLHQSDLHQLQTMHSEIENANASTSIQSTEKMTEYARLIEKIERSEMEKEVDIGYLKRSIDKLTEGLKRSHAQYNDLEESSKLQHEKLMTEIRAQKNENASLKKKMVEFQSTFSSKRQAEERRLKIQQSLSKKALATQVEKKNGVDEKFEDVMKHAVSSGKNEEVEKLKQCQHDINRKRIFYSLQTIKFQKLLQTLGVVVLSEKSYATASAKEKLMTLLQLVRVDRFFRFINNAALRWRLQKSDPSYAQIADSYKDIISGPCSINNLSESIRLGIRLRHESLVVLALVKARTVLSQVNEKNPKFLFPTVYTLIGGLHSLSLIMRVFVSSSMVQQESLGVVSCIFSCVSSLEELESSLHLTKSGIFESSVRILFWHSEDLGLCTSAITVARKIAYKFEKDHEKFCKKKQCHAMLQYASAAADDADCFEKFCSFLCVLGSASLDMLQRLSDTGICSQFSSCLSLKGEDENVAKTISRTILSLISSRGLIFVQEVFGSSEFFSAMNKCLSWHAHHPEVFKILDLSYLSVCGQNQRIISRIPAKPTAQLMIEIIRSVDLTSDIVKPILVTISTLCLSDNILRSFYANKLHFVIEKAFIDKVNSELNEFAIKTCQIISDVDPDASRAEREKIAQERLKLQQEEQRKREQAEAMKENAKKQSLEEERLSKLGEEDRQLNSNLSSAQKDAVLMRIQARHEAEMKANALREQYEQEKAVMEKCAEEEINRMKNAEAASQLKASLFEADKKAKEAFEYQESIRVANALSAQIATESIAAEMIEDEVVHVVESLARKEVARLAKAMSAQEEAQRLAKADAQERMARVHSELERAERESQQGVTEDQRDSSVAEKGSADVSVGGVGASGVSGVHEEVSVQSLDDDHLTDTRASANEVKETKKSKRREKRASRRSMRASPDQSEGDKVQVREKVDSNVAGDSMNTFGSDAVDMMMDETVSVAENLVGKVTEEVTKSTEPTRVECTQVSSSDSHGACEEKQDASTERKLGQEVTVEDEASVAFKSIEEEPSTADRHQSNTEDTLLAPSSVSSKHEEMRPSRKSVTVCVEEEHNGSAEHSEGADHVEIVALEMIDDEVANIVKRVVKKEEAKISKAGIPSQIDSGLREARKRSTKITLSKQKAEEAQELEIDTEDTAHVANPQKDITEEKVKNEFFHVAERPARKEVARLAKAMSAQEEAQRLAKADAQERMARVHSELERAERESQQGVTEDQRDSSVAEKGSADVSVGGVGASGVSGVHEEVSVQSLDDDHLTDTKASANEVKETKKSKRREKRASRRSMRASPDQSEGDKAQQLIGALSRVVNFTDCFRIMKKAIKVNNEALATAAFARLELLVQPGEQLEHHLDNMFDTEKSISILLTCTQTFVSSVSFFEAVMTFLRSITRSQKASVALCQGGLFHILFGLFASKSIGAEAMQNILDYVMEVSRQHRLVKDAGERGIPVAVNSLTANLSHQDVLIKLLEFIKLCCESFDSNRSLFCNCKGSEVMVNVIFQVQDSKRIVECACDIIILFCDSSDEAQKDFSRVENFSVLMAALSQSSTSRFDIFSLIYCVISKIVSLWQSQDSIDQKACASFKEIFCSVPVAEQNWKEVISQTLQLFTRFCTVQAVKDQFKKGDVLSSLSALMLRAKSDQDILEKVLIAIQCLNE